MNRTKTFAAIVVSVACFCLCAKAVTSGTAGATKKGGLMNPFFAMDTGTKDDKHRTPKAQAEMLKELGYAGIGCGELSSLSEMVEELDRNGLKMFAVYTGVWIDPDKQKYDPQLEQAIKVLRGRDAILWIFMQSKKHKLSSPEGDARAVEIIGEIADVAHASGLKVALYPHTAMWLERVEDAVRLAKKINRRNVGVTFNLCHWLKVDSEETMNPLMKLAMPYLSVVTINGADSGGDNWKQLIQTLDRGTFDICKFLKTLKELGYTGPIGFQGYGIGGDAHENLKRSMDAWRRLSARIAAEEK